MTPQPDEANGLPGSEEMLVLGTVDQPGALDNSDEMRRKGLYCDFEIRVGTEPAVVVCAHKLILSQQNAFFERMLKANPMLGFVKFDDLNPETVDLVITYIYTGRIRIALTPRNILRLKITASKFEVNGLMDAVVEDMRSRISAENWIRFQEIARLSRLTVLDAHVDNWIRMNFSVIAASQQFRYFLQFAQVYRLVSLASREITPESEILKAILDWVTLDEIKRKKFMPELTKGLRFFDILHQQPHLLQNKLLDAKQVYESLVAQAVQSHGQHSTTLQAHTGVLTEGPPTANLEATALNSRQGSIYETVAVNRSDPHKSFNNPGSSQNGHVVPPKNLAIMPRENTQTLNPNGETRESQLLDNLSSVPGSHSSFQDVRDRASPRANSRSSAVAPSSTPAAVRPAEDQHRPHGDGQHDTAYSSEATIRRNHQRDGRSKVSNRGSAQTAPVVDPELNPQVKTETPANLQNGGEISQPNQENEANFANEQLVPDNASEAPSNDEQSPASPTAQCSGTPANGHGFREPPHSSSAKTWSSNSDKPNCSTTKRQAAVGDTDPEGPPKLKAEPKQEEPPSLSDQAEHESHRHIEQTLHASGCEALRDDRQLRILGSQDAPLYGGKPGTPCDQERLRSCSEGNLSPGGQLEIHCSDAHPFSNPHVENSSSAPASLPSGSAESLSAIQAPPLGDPGMPFRVKTEPLKEEPVSADEAENELNQNAEHDMPASNPGIPHDDGQFETARRAEEHYRGASPAQMSSNLEVPVRANGETAAQPDDDSSVPISSFRKKRKRNSRDFRRRLKEAQGRASNDPEVPASANSTQPPSSSDLDAPNCIISQSQPSDDPDAPDPGSSRNNRKRKWKKATGPTPPSPDVPTDCNPLQPPARQLALCGGSQQAPRSDPPNAALQERQEAQKRIQAESIPTPSLEEYLNGTRSLGHYENWLIQFTNSKEFLKMSDPPITLGQLAGNELSGEQYPDPRWNTQSLYSYLESVSCESRSDLAIKRIERLRQMRKSYLNIGVNSTTRKLQKLILSHVMSYLSRKDLLKCREVSLQWSILALDTIQDRDFPFIWRTSEIDFAAILETLQSGRPGFLFSRIRVDSKIERRDPLFEALDFFGSAILELVVDVTTMDRYSSKTSVNLFFPTLNSILEKVKGLKALSILGLPKKLPRNTFSRSKVLLPELKRLNLGQPTLEKPKYTTEFINSVFSMAPKLQSLEVQWSCTPDITGCNTGIEHILKAFKERPQQVPTELRQFYLHGRVTRNSLSDLFTLFPQLNTLMMETFICEDELLNEVLFLARNHFKSLIVHTLILKPPVKITLYTTMPELEELKIFSTRGIRMLKSPALINIFPKLRELALNEYVFQQVFMSGAEYESVRVLKISKYTKSLENGLHIEDLKSAFPNLASLVVDSACQWAVINEILVYFPKLEKLAFTLQQTESMRDWARLQVFHLSPDYTSLKELLLLRTCECRAFWRVLRQVDFLLQLPPLERLGFNNMEVDPPFLSLLQARHQHVEVNTGLHDYLHWTSQSST